MKTKKLKYLKNPEALFDREDVMNYIYSLEDNDELDKLPMPILVYYVVGVTLTDEVNNGGFAQYLSNSSVATMFYLEDCVKAIGNIELIAIISELLYGISIHLRTMDINKIKNLDYSDEFDALLSVLDERFYDLDEKQDVMKLAKKYYQNNIPEEKFVIAITKERESENVRYFISNAVTVTYQEAIESFMGFLAEFPEAQFEINIMRWNEFFRIDAIDNSNSFDLSEIMNHFTDENYSFSKDVGSVHKRDKMLGIKFFGGILNGICIKACDEKKNLWRIDINKSGFEKNEYKMHRYLFMSYFPEATIQHRIASSITLGDISYDNADIEIIKSVLVRKAQEQGNIKHIHEEIVRKFGEKHIENIIYEKNI